jgi:hypothetical protein
VALRAAVRCSQDSAGAGPSKCIIIIGCPAIARPLWDDPTEKSKDWARWLSRKLELKLQYLEALEVLRSRFGTTALISRWFSQMAPEIAGTPPFLLFNYDEIVIAAEPHRKVVTTCDRVAFRRKAAKAAHRTLGMCVAPFGDGPPPFFVFAGLNEPSEFALFEMTVKLHVTNSASGWVTANVFVELATALVIWLDAYRARLPPPHNQETAVLLFDKCQVQCILPAPALLAAHNCNTVSFPPHVTHILQPVDVSCARCFKAALSTNLHTFERHPEHLTIARNSDASRARVSLVMAALSSLWHCSMAICLNGYQKCGVYPWSPEKALDSCYVHNIPVDPGAVDMMTQAGKFHRGSSVMTSPDFLNALAVWIERRNGAGL